jgi:hypothetical protein
MSEQWLPIPGFDDLYEASDLGRIRSYAAFGRKPRIDTPRLLTPSQYHKNGYVHVSLGRKGGSVSVHRLVMLAFEGPSNGLDVDHIDGDPRNNELKNLRYVSHAENMILPRERKPLCKRGHLYSEHGYLSSRGRRCCGECRRISDRKRRPAQHNGPKTHCKRGHEFTPDNTYVRPNSTRKCRECSREREQELRLRKRLQETRQAAA